MVKLCWLKNPVKGVFTLKFIGPSHIDADIGLIVTECGPDCSATLAEGDGWTRISTHQEMRPAELAADYLNRQSLHVGGLTALPTRTFRDRKVIPKTGDEAVPGIAVPWQGGIKDRTASVKEMHGMNG
jgi:hypothetical protein